MQTVELAVLLQMDRAHMLRFRLAVHSTTLYVSRSMVENILMKKLFSCKGQEISEENCGVLKYSQKPTAFFPYFCPKGLKWVKKIKILC